jgi:hypothetical protein
MVGTVTKHLVVDHSLEVATLLVTNKAYTLLPECLLTKKGSEYRISVYMEKILKIFLQGTSAGIQSLVRVGHGVHEGIGTALEQGHEWVSHRIALASCQHTVFQDMGDTAIIVGKRPENIAEETLPIRIDKLKDLHIGLDMPEQVSGSLILIKLGNLHQLEARELIP